MKRIIVFCILLVSYIGKSQYEELDFGRNFINCEVVFNDNTIKKGLISNFLENNRVDVENKINGSIEYNFNLIDGEFEFKENQDSKIQYLKKRDVKEVRIFFDKDPIVYKLLDVQEFDNDGSLKKINKKAWLPVHYTDEITVFAFNVFYSKIKEKKFNEVKKENLKVTKTFIYINHKRDSNAFLINLNDDFEIEQIFKRNHQNAWIFEIIFKDCPEYFEILKNKSNKELSSFKFSEKELDLAINKIINKKDLKQYQKRIEVDRVCKIHSCKPLVNLIQDYLSHCKK